MMSFKTKLYFLLTAYFQFWARIVLKKWQPIVIAVVGSAGKTTAMEMIGHLLQTKISLKTSYKTNAASAIPLNILGLSQKTFSIGEWLKLILTVPFKIWQKPKAKIYLCEMDTDRSGEMALHTKLIKPDICCWLSANPAHTQNFKGNNQTEIISDMLSDMTMAAKSTKSLVLANFEDQNIIKKAATLGDKIQWISLEQNSKALVSLQNHHVSLSGTTAEFAINPEIFEKLSGKPVSFTQITLSIPLAIVSKINMYGLGMALFLALSFDIDKDVIIEIMRNFRLPAGRMSLFSGKQATTIIDSSYNASKMATIDALQVLKQLGDSKSLAILGDMRELGQFAQKEHEELAQAIVDINIRRLILVGHMMKQYVLPVLLNNGYILNQTVFCHTPKLAKQLVNQKDFIQKGETILIKGSQNTLFLEEITQTLLASTKDEQFLCRREKLWQIQRSKIY